MNHILKFHYIINHYDVYLHVKFGVIPSNCNIATLDFIVMLGPDLL